MIHDASLLKGVRLVGGKLGEINTAVPPSLTTFLSGSELYPTLPAFVREGVSILSGGFWIGQRTPLTHRKVQIYVKSSLQVKFLC